ncbi:MAG: PD40 domain-containing protein [Anaerolineales bacterium]|nr:PD40 domain-containing protein [Anaerolineales bacterium]
MPLPNQSLLYRRYRILAELGRGGMGAVYRAHDENLGVEVAIKENLFVSPEFAQQFRREAVLLAALRHPSLPRVTDHFVIPDQGQYLVMDYIAGDDARERLIARNAPLPEAEVLRWARDILDALVYLHGLPQPVVHRDIKPGNVKITPEGRAVLVDFGLAKLHVDAQETAAGAKALSPGFSPPEQYGAGRTEPRSDLYALGATLYALLVGQPPPDSLERALGQKALLPLRLINPAVTPETAATVERALALKPEGRFVSAAAFLAALSHDDRTTQSGQLPALPAQATLPTPAAAPRPSAPASRPVAAPSRPAPSAPPAPPPALPVMPPPMPPPVAAPRRRFPWALAVGAAVVVLLAVGGGALWAARSLLSPAATATSPATLTAPLPTTETVPVVAATDTRAPAPTDAPTIAPSATDTPAATLTPAPSDTPAPTATATAAPTDIGGGLPAGAIAFVSERGGRPQIYLMDADGGNITQLTNVEAGACQPAWSPDGQQLLFVTPCSGKREQYPDSVIYAIRADGTGLRPFITILGGEWDPAWSTAGVAYVFNGDGRPQIFIADADGANPRRVSNIHSGDSQPAWSGDATRLAFRNNSRSGTPALYWMFADGTFAEGGANPDVLTRDVTPGYPAWSPDGQYVAYLVGSDIWLVGWDQLGFGAQQITTAGPNAEPAWSPDSQWLVFESWRDAAQHDLYRMSLTGVEVVRLNNDAALDYQPAWRPRP